MERSRGPLWATKEVYRDPGLRRSKLSIRPDGPAETAFLTNRRAASCRQGPVKRRCQSCH